MRPPLSSTLVTCVGAPSSTSKRANRNRPRSSSKRSEIARAGELFAKIGLFLKAAECYQKHGDFLTAGEIYEKSGRIREAAASFAKASDFTRAAALYSGRVAELTRDGYLPPQRRSELDTAARGAAHFFEKAGEKDEAVDVLVRAERYEQAAELCEQLDLIQA